MQQTASPASQAQPFGDFRIVQPAAALDFIDNRLRRAIEPAGKRRAEFPDRLKWQAIEKAALQCQHECHLVCEPQWRELRLRKDRADTLPALDPVLDEGIRDAAEARKHFEFQELSIIEPQRRRRLSQGRCLGLAADTADAGSNIHRRLMTFVEQSCIEHDLAVGDRDQICWNIGAQVAGIQFGDRQRCQRPASGGLGKLRGALKQPRMNIKYIAGVCLASGRLSGQ